MYNDELKISAESNYKCPIESAEAIYDTIKKFVQQD